MAVTVIAATIAEQLGTDDTTATRLLGAATPLVERYAPDAPEALQNEATIRTAAWLHEAPSSGIRAESAGPLSANYTPVATGALRASGSMSLLRPWKKRRAGAIE